jgi:hypothetical protein
LIIQNKEIFKVFYSLIIILISALIVLKAHSLYRLSLHNGLRYFRNAFFFFALAFASRYLLRLLFDINSLSHLTFISLYLFEFFLIVGGFFLIYSLLWKKFEPQGVFSSLFSPIITVLYFIALIITTIDLIWDFYYLLFISQIIIFLYASIISYFNFRRDEGKHKFPRFYFLAMVLALVTWILNFLVATVFNWNLILTINVYIFNSLFFLLFLYGIIKVMRR